MITGINIRDFQKQDFPACAKIYQEGLDTSIATFETVVPSWEQWNAKFLKQCHYVAKSEEVVLGWIALTPFSSREVYRGVAEVTLYIREDARGKGVGKALLEHLIVASEAAGFWTLQAKIFPQNISSLRLFEKCGFRKVGVREKLGMRDGVWYDNVLMERRAKVENIFSLK